MTLLLLYLLIAIGVSFLCSILEAVLLSITPSFVENIASQQPKKGQVLIGVKDRLDQSISGVLILNTFAHTMGAAGVGAQASEVFGAQWETVIAVLLTLAILYLSEIIPKTIGATFWRQLAMPAAHTIYWITKLVYPLIWISTFITRLFRKKDGNTITREEIISLASLGYKMGTLINQENEYLINILKLREIKTEQIITPRTVMHSLSEDLTIEQALDQPKTREFTRIPVFKGNRDTIVGVITNRELLYNEREGHAHELIGQFTKPITRISNNVPVQKLLDMFVRGNEQIFLVEDQYGQTMGLVTLEDAIETLLGQEIVDETDTIADLQKYAKTQYRDRLRDTKKD